MFQQHQQTFAGKPVNSGGWGSGAHQAVPGLSGETQNPFPNISTLGFPFKYTVLTEQYGINTREYKLYHINAVDMFQNYTNEELRINDYVRQRFIDPPPYFYES